MSDTCSERIALFDMSATGGESEREIQSLHRRPDVHEIVSISDCGNNIVAVLYRTYGGAETSESP